MHSLYLFRHGKSDWDAPHAHDHERPLTTRGEKAARCMGKLLRHARQVPELAVSSSALRARETLQHAVRAGKWASEIRIDASLYDTTATAVVQWLGALDSRADKVLLVGHEPTWSELASDLVGNATLRVPTASMLRIDLEIASWADIRPGQGTLRWLLPPKLVYHGKYA